MPGAMLAATESVHGSVKSDARLGRSGDPPFSVPLKRSAANEKEMNCASHTSGAQCPSHGGTSCTWWHRKTVLRANCKLVQEGVCRAHDVHVSRTLDVQVTKASVAEPVAQARGVPTRCCCS